MSVDKQTELPPALQEKVDSRVEELWADDDYLADVVAALLDRIREAPDLDLLEAIDQRLVGIAKKEIINDGED